MATIMSYDSSEDEPASADGLDGEATEDFLRFLRDEGLEMLSIFRRIRDARKRALVMELASAIVEGQPMVDGH